MYYTIYVYLTFKVAQTRYTYTHFDVNKLYVKINLPKDKEENLNHRKMMIYKSSNELLWILGSSVSSSSTTKLYSPALGLFLLLGRLKYKDGVLSVCLFVNHVKSSRQIG